MVMGLSPTSALIRLEVVLGCFLQAQKGNAYFAGSAERVEYGNYAVVRLFPAVIRMLVARIPGAETRRLPLCRSRKENKSPLHDKSRLESNPRISPFLQRSPSPKGVCEKGDPRNILISSDLKVKFMVGSPFSDPPLGDGETWIRCRASGPWVWGSHHGQFSKVKSGKMGPAPGRFERSKGIFK